MSKKPSAYWALLAFVALACSVALRGVFDAWSTGQYLYVVFDSLVIAVTGSVLVVSRKGKGEWD